MTIYSSSLTWDIPQTEEAGRLQYMGLQKVGYDLEAKPPPQLNTKEDLRVGRVEAVLGGNQSKHYILIASRDFPGGSIRHD